MTELGTKWTQNLTDLITLCSIDQNQLTNTSTYQKQMTGTPPHDLIPPLR